MTEPCDLTAVEARRLIGRRALSPVELLESCLTRIDETDHAVNAVVARDDAASREAARAAEQMMMNGEELGPLHGLPVGIKDLTATKGLRTTWGSPLFRDHVPEEDHSLVANIRAAGGIIAGKTNTPEFGAGANTRNAVYGATGNPFDPTKNAAGSSGGSGVALAVNQFPLCSGSDMGGSLRNPAAFNGIVGFRPTPGAVPDEEKKLGWSGLGVQGPMARNVADLALLMSVMSTNQAHDPLATTIHNKRVREPGDFYPIQPIDLGGLRVAVTPDFGFAPTENHIREVFAEKVALLRHHFRSADDATPDCTGTDEAFEVLRSTNFVAGHIENWNKARDKLGPNIVANMTEALKYTIADVSRASALQTQLYQRWQGFFRDYDVILSPAITISPRPWTELFPKEIDGKPTRTYFHWLALAYAVTVVGHPAISLPVGRDRAGMPFGLQIVGPRGGDATVIRVAAALEEALAADPHTRRPVPDIAALKAAPPISGMPHFMGFN